MKRNFVNLAPLKKGGSHIKRSLLTVSLLLVLLLISSKCGQVASEEKTIEPTKNFTFDVQGDPEYDFLQTCNKLKIVPLETSAISLVGKPRKMIVENNRIYLLDYRSASVKCFRMDGSFIEEISNKGDGPGGYYILTDIDFNKMTGRLELLTPQGDVISYNENTKEFRREYSVSAKSVAFFENVDDDLVVFYSVFDEKRLYFFSRKKGKLINDEMPNFDLDKKMRINIKSPFFETSEGICLVDPQTMDVYRIEDSNLIKMYALDFGDFNLNIEEVPIGTRSTNRGFLDYLEKEKIVHPVWVGHENEKSITIFATYANSSSVSYVINKQTGEVNKVYFPVENFFIPYACSFNDTYYGYFTNTNGYKRASKKNPKLEVLAKIQEENNPIVIIYGNCEDE